MKKIYAIIINFIFIYFNDFKFKYIYNLLIILFEKLLNLLSL